MAVADFFADAGMMQTMLVFDTSAVVEVAPGVQASVRPFFWRMKDGTWKNYTPQASLRYEFKRKSVWRVEAGRFASPVGLGMTENRPSLNPGLFWCHRPYYGRLPVLGDDDEVAPHALIAANYPIGVQVNTSGDHWDARAALVDRAPVDVWTTYEPTPRRANATVGGGISPRQGIRIGAATSWGRSGDAESSQLYRLINVEAEYAFGYTRVSGEWTRDQFDTPVGHHVASGWTFQAQQTLSPRVFLHSRLSTIAADAALPEAGFERQDSWFLDTTLGYLVTPEVTIRVSHAAIEDFTASSADHQVGVSVVWSRRWW